MEKAEINTSFKELFEQYSNDVLRYSFSILKNYEESRDIVQETFTHFLESEASFKGECSYKAWLFIITRNLCYDRLRNKNFRIDRIDDHLFKKNYTESFDVGISVRDALLKISKEESELLYLKEYEGYSYAEISQITNLSVQNVAVKLFRAKKVLRKYLSDYKENK